MSDSSIEKSTSVQKIEMGSPKVQEHEEVSSESMPPSSVGEQLAWSRIREVCQDGFSEFLGTMTLLLFGDGVVAQVVLSSGAKGDYQSISWGWG